jgi:glycosyltransferase involved in cell wall biosynthesis
MFDAARMPPVEYADPWTASFESRLAALTRRHRRIAYFYHRPDTSTFRYRVFNMIEALTSGTGSTTSAAWFQESELPRMDKFIDRADALVVCRARYSPDVGRMIGRAKARGIPVFYDIDDFVFNADYAHLVMHTLDQDTAGEAPMDFWFAYLGRHGATLRLCDQAIVTNAFLGQRITEVAKGVPVHIIPNFLNSGQQAFSIQLFRAKQDSGFSSSGHCHVGYFSGTPTHNKDFAIAADALAELMDRYPDVKLRVVGFFQPHGGLIRHAHRIDLHPLQDFINLQRLIGEVEINIAPLQNNLFTNCKSELKYFESAIVGTATLATPTFTFSNAIEDGVTGLLCASHQWGEKLQSAMELLSDRSAYAEMVERAFEHAVTAYGWDSHAGSIEKTIFGAHK